MARGRPTQGEVLSAARCQVGGGSARHAVSGVGGVPIPWYMGDLSGSRTLPLKERNAFLPDGELCY